MGILIRVFNYFWFSTWGYEDHVDAENQLALDNARRAIARAERVLARASKPQPLILKLGLRQD